MAEIARGRAIWRGRRGARPSPPVDAAARGWALAAAGLALAPLLLQLPGEFAVLVAGAMAGVAGLSRRRPMPAALRLLLALGLLAAVFWMMGGLRFGRDTGCALLAAMLAIKPAEAATLRDARSLVGFALFAPFAAFLLDQGPLLLVLGLVAVLAGLLALQRLADAEAGLGGGRGGLRARLRRVGGLIALGLPLALAAFWLFPRLPTPLWGVPERALARPGLSDTMAPGEWIDFMTDDRPALRAQFFGTTPAQSQMYWRGPVLWDYDGRSWTRPRGMPFRTDRAAGAVDFAPAAPAWDYQIEFEPTDRRQVVALDLPLAAPDGLHLSPDGEMFAPRPVSALSRWRLRSASPERFETGLPDSLRRRALALPAGHNPRTLALAAQWRRQAGADDGAVVARAMAWIAAEFGYTLETPLPGRHAVDEFLFEHQRGYCEHFSSAFVVLMRAAGIPARVVTGYAGGVRNPFGDYWVVRRMDAHAWAEVWLPGRGWVRADPTAAVAPERIYDTLEDRATVGGGALLQGLTRFGDFGDWLRRGWNDWMLGFNAERQQRMLRPLGIERAGGGRLAAAFALLALALVGGMAWLLAREERGADPLLHAWRRLGRRYARLGLGREPHEPALAWAQRVARARPDLAARLLPLSRRFAAARYAGAVEDADALVRELRRHRPQFPSGDPS